MSKKQVSKTIIDKNKKERIKKFSLMDEFISPTGVGNIEYKPNLTQRELSKIKLQNDLVDVPIALKQQIESYLSESFEESDTQKLALNKARENLVSASNSPTTDMGNIKVEALNSAGPIEPVHSTGSLTDSNSLANGSLRTGSQTGSLTDSLIYKKIENSNAEIKLEESNNFESGPSEPVHIASNKYSFDLNETNIVNSGAKSNLSIGGEAKRTGSLTDSLTVSLDDENQTISTGSRTGSQPIHFVEVEKYGKNEFKNQESTGLEPVHSTGSLTDSQSPAFKPKDYENLKKAVYSLRSNTLNILRHLTSLTAGKGGAFLISYKELAYQLGLNQNTLKTSCRRLSETNLIIDNNESTKKGGAGILRKIEVPSQIRDILQTLTIMNHKIVFQKERTGSLTDSQPVHSTGSQPSSKLVSNYNTNLLTSESVVGLEVRPYDDVDISCLSELGITRKHLGDIFNQKLGLSSYDVQSLIDKFYKYSQNPKNLGGVKDVRALFISFARRLSRGEDPLEDILSFAEDESEMVLKDIRLQVEEKRRVKRELLDAEFELWFENLSDDEKRMRMPGGLNLKDENFKVFLRGEWEKGR